MRRVVQSQGPDNQDKREAAAAGIWPPPGQMTWRRCTATTEKRGKEVPCEEVGLVPVVAGARPIRVDPAVEAKARCKNHGGPK